MFDLLFDCKMLQSLRYENKYYFLLCFFLTVTIFVSCQKIRFPYVPTLLTLHNDKNGKIEVNVFDATEN